MNINRNNYESFFLLYVDNELSDTQKKAVEEFAAENPDLKIELDLLKETIILPETISFDGKQDLLKKQMPSELQEQLLMHLDNELNKKDADSLEKMIQSDNELSKEFSLLKNTKLDPSEKIAFPDKSILYRKTTGRVIAFNYRRLAAAVITGILFTSAFFLMRNDNPSGGTNIAGTVQDTPVNTDTNEPATPANTPQLASATNDTNQGTQPVAENDKTNAPAIVSVEKIGLNEKRISQPSSTTPIEKNIQVESNNLPELAVQHKNDIIAPVVSNNEMVKSNIEEKKNEVVPVTDIDLTKRDDNNVSLASFSETEQDKVMYMDEEKVSRTKLGAFIKKAKRVVERNAKLKTGNLHIGGFDLAFK